MAHPQVSVVGLHGGECFGAAAQAALVAADVLVGSASQFAWLRAWGPALGGEQVELFGPVDDVVALVDERRRRGQQVCVLAAGDAGFFGMAGLLTSHFSQEEVDFHPAPTSVALAFGRVGLHWDDAVVTSVRGTPIHQVVAEVLEAPKAAVMVSSRTPAEAVGAALLAAGAGDRAVWVCSRLGEPDESVTATGLAGLATGTFDPISVVLLVADAVDAAVAAGEDGPSVAWRRRAGSDDEPAPAVPDDELAAVVLGSLRLRPSDVLWEASGRRADRGLGAAAVAAVPGVRLITVGEISAAALAGLPDPDRVLLGDDVQLLEVALDRLRPNGVVVAVCSTLASAAVAGERLGDVTQVQLSRGAPIGPNGELRLVGGDPVFVASGPSVGPRP